MNGNKAYILGVAIDSTSTSFVLNTIVGLASGKATEKGKIIFTPNPEFIVEAQADFEFKELLNKADLSLPDGIGLVWAGRILGQPIKQRVSGADVVKNLLEEGNRKQEPVESQERWTIGIAGARRGVQSEAGELLGRLRDIYPNIKFINLDDPKFQIANFKFQIVFACHGMKKQENWIWDNKDKILANVFVGVGGSLDFLTGYTKRAPAVMRRIGLEWLWRGIQKPKHFKRVWKATVVFGWIVIRERLRKLT